MKPKPEDAQHDGEKHGVLHDEWIVGRASHLLHGAPADIADERPARNPVSEFRAARRMTGSS